MSFIGLPGAAVAIYRLGFHLCPAARTNQHPVVGGIVHDAVQRGAHHLTQRARFDAGSDGLGHDLIVSVCGDADQSLGLPTTPIGMGSRSSPLVVPAWSSTSAPDLKKSREFALVERQLSVSADLRCRDPSVCTQSRPEFRVRHLTPANCSRSKLESTEILTSSEMSGAEDGTKA